MKYPLEVPTTKEKIYDQFLTVVNFLMYEKDESNKSFRSPLTNKELSVLASLMYFNDRYRNLPEPERSEYIMSSEIRKKIRDRLDIKANHLNNIIARLKTKYYIGHPVLVGNSLSEALKLYFDEDLSVEFKLSYDTKQETAPINRGVSKKVQSASRESDEFTLLPGQIHSQENIGSSEG